MQSNGGKDYVKTTVTSEKNFSKFHFSKIV